MSTAHRLYRAFATALALALLAELAAAELFSDFIIFGDSLSDVGNTRQASIGLYPGLYYADGRFSNGPVLWLKATSTMTSRSAISTPRSSF